MSARHVVFVVSSIALGGCRIPPVEPLDASAPEPLVAAAAGLGGEVDFHVEGLPDDAPGADEATLSPAAAVESAVRNDPKLQQALARWRKARAECDEARLLPNPLLTIGLGFAGLTAPDLKPTVGITQEIAAYLQRPHKAGAADARLRVAVEEALGAALDAVAEARERYAALQWLQAQLPVLESRRDILTRLRDFERLKLERGEGVRADVTALEAERAGVSVEVAEREAELREGRVALARIVGRPSSAATWTLDAATAAAPPEGDERAWIRTALQRRPEIRALGWELAALGAERNLIGTWIWDGAAVGAEAEYDEGFTVGPTLSFALPIHDPSGPREAANLAAQAEIRHKVAETRRKVIEDVRTAWAAMESARRTLDVMATEQLPVLERRREQLEKTFRAGESDVVALLLADQALQEVRARRIELEGRAALARIRLERAAAGSGVAPSRSPDQEPKDGGTPR